MSTTAADTWKTLTRFWYHEGSWNQFPWLTYDQLCLLCFVCVWFRGSRITSPGSIWLTNNTEFFGLRKSYMQNLIFPSFFLFRFLIFVMSWLTWFLTEMVTVNINLWLISKSIPWNISKPEELTGGNGWYVIVYFPNASFTENINSNRNTIFGGFFYHLNKQVKSAKWLLIWWGKSNSVSGNLNITIRYSNYGLLHTSCGKRFVSHLYKVA